MRVVVLDSSNRIYLFICFRCAHALLVHNCLRQATVMIKTKPLLRLRPDMAARIPNQKQVAIDMWECVSKFLLL